MRSSLDREKVLLPSFEEMMRMIAGAKVPAEGMAHGALRPEGSLAFAEEGCQPEDSPILEEEGPEDTLARTQALCEEMRCQAEEDVRLFLEQARQEAEALALEAREAEAARARQALQGERQKALSAALGAAEALKKAGEELYSTLEPYLLDTALHIAERILHYELDRNDQAYISMVRSLLDQAAIAEEVALHLAPGRFSELTAGGDFAEEMAKRGVEIKRDPALSEEDCLVTSDRGSIKGGAAIQLARIRYAVRNQQLD